MMFHLNLQIIVKNKQTVNISNFHYGSMMLFKTSSKTEKKKHQLYGFSLCQSLMKKKLLKIFMKQKTE